MNDSTSRFSRPSPFPDFDAYVEELECYLDGELQPAEAARVRQRLAQETAYAAALGRLSSQRCERMEVFDAIGREMAASVPAVESALVAGFRQDAGRRSVWPSTVPMWLRYAGGMAAAVVVGFGVGLLGGLDWGDGSPRPYPSADSRAFTPVIAADDPRRPVLVSQDAAGRVVRTPIRTDGGRGTLVVLDHDGGVRFQAPLDASQIPLDRDPTRFPGFHPVDDRGPRP